MRIGDGCSAGPMGADVGDAPGHVCIGFWVSPLLDVGLCILTLIRILAGGGVWVGGEGGQVGWEGSKEKGRGDG